MVPREEPKNDEIFFGTSKIFLANHSVISLEKLHCKKRILISDAKKSKLLV